LAESVEQGIEKARMAISSGAAQQKLEALATLTNEFN
jgi:anthranilate phosphoribosyltransferase